MREILLLAAVGLVSLVAAAAWLTGQVAVGICCTTLALSLTDHAMSD